MARHGTTPPPPAGGGGGTPTPPPSASPTPPTTPPPTGGGRGISDAASKIVNQLFNKAKKPIAKFIAIRLLTPPQRKKIADNDDAIETAATIAAIITPHGGWWEMTDENMQDLVHEVVEICKGIVAAGNNPKAIIPGAPAFDITKQRQRVARAWIKIPDRAKRDNFIAWFNDLTTNPAKAADLGKFLELVAGIISDDDLPKFLESHPNDLNALLALIPNPPPAPTHMTYAALRDAISKDPALTARVAAFLAATLANETRFWECVKKHIDTLDEFKTVMALPDHEIFQHLGIVPVLDELNAKWAAHVKPDVDAAVKITTDGLKKVRDDINISPKTKSFVDRVKTRRQKSTDRLKALKS